MNDAKEFINKNLKELASELVGWRNTGLLNDGNGGIFRELVTVLKTEYSDVDSFSIAEQLVIKACLEYTSKG